MDVKGFQQNCTLVPINGVVAVKHGCRGIWGGLGFKDSYELPWAGICEFDQVVPEQSSRGLAQGLGLTKP